MSASSAERSIALARLFTVSLAMFSASSVLITSWCSALISTPMYCAAWLRADSIALVLPSSREEAPSFAPEKYSVSEELGALASQAGGLGDELVFTAAFSPPQAQSANAASAQSLLRTDGLRRRGLLGQLPGVGLQPVDVVDLGEHVAVVRQRVGLVHHRLPFVVVARVLVGKAEVPIALRHLRRLQLHVLLRRLGGVVEGGLGLLPVAALRPADSASSCGMSPSFWKCAYRNSWCGTIALMKRSTTARRDAFSSAMRSICCGRLSSARFTSSALSS